MGIRKLGDIVILDFVTHNPLTGFVQDADFLPTCEVFEDQDDNPILTPIVTKRVDKIGNYKVPIEATAGNGFGVGKSYNVIVSVSVNNIPAKARIGSFSLDSKRNSDLADLSLPQVEASTVIAKEVTVNHIKTETDKIPEMKDWIQILKSIGTGRWKIENNQLIIFNEDDEVLLTFNLKNKEGILSEENVYERVPVN